MGDPVDKDDKQADELARLPSLLKEWLGIVATFGVAVATVLAVLLPGQTPAALQVIGYALALALVVVGALIFVRVRRRQRSRQPREKRQEKWEREAAGAHRTAFRGLFPYQEDDELPGEHRRLEARRLVTQFSEPTFSFGVVCGDSGCGKTSLLRSAIQNRLKAAGEEFGFGVLYVGSPRELADDGAQASGAHDTSACLRRELDRLRQRAEGAARGRSLILILDQFEEFFIAYRSPELRLEIGRFLNGLIESSPPVRILCAIRRDHLADMKDLAPQSPDPAAGGNFFELVSFQSVFKLNNFTVEQAARVIRECAEHDGVELDEEFAVTLASDLGEGDVVRPPELQIVCAALGGSLTVAGYRLAGGARGILSHHIEGAIDYGSDANVGRRVLRALCDFPAHAKREPQTEAAIAEAVGVEGAEALTRAALRQFERARLVVAERDGEDETVYALIHDYLVDAVAKATGDVTTRDEEANQLLQYYVAEYRDDPKTRIPYRRLRFVRKYADPKRLADPTARRLLRASVFNLATSTAALAALVLITTTLLVALTTTRRVWHQHAIGRHREGSEPLHGDNWVIQPKRGLLLSGISSGTSGYDNIALWDVKTAHLIDSFRHERLRYVAPEYVLGYSRGEPTVTALHIPTARELQTSLPAQYLLYESSTIIEWGGDIYANASGTVIAAHRVEPIVEGELKELHQPPTPVSVFSVADNNMIGEMLTCRTAPGGNFYVSGDGEYFLKMCYEGEAVTPTAFNVRTKEKRTLLRTGYRATGHLVFDERTSRAATLELSSERRFYLVLWDVRRGLTIEYTDVSLNLKDSGDISVNLSFTPDGEYIYINDSVEMGPGRRNLIFFRTTGLRRVTALPGPEVRVLSVSNHADNTDRNSPVFLAWPSTFGGTYLWDLSEPEPKLLSGLTLHPFEYRNPNVAVSELGLRAIILRRDKGVAELWDFKRGKKLSTLDIPGRFNEVEFTIGGNAVSANVEGGTVSLFRAEDGKKITDDLRNIGGTKRAIYYDEKCRHIHVWTDEGRVLRYTEGWYLFGRESWFWPTERCEAQ